MRRALLLLVVLTWTFPFLPGCGSDAPPSPEVQQQRLEETEAAMQKGVEAMKHVKK